jgi:hypothetical protein
LETRGADRSPQTVPRECSPRSASGCRTQSLSSTVNGPHGSWISDPGPQDVQLSLVCTAWVAVRVRPPIGQLSPSAVHSSSSSTSLLRYRYGRLLSTPYGTGSGCRRGASGR